MIALPNPGHLPVMRDEVIAALQPHAGARFIDATFGGGGHSALLLERSAPDGRVLAIDADPEAQSRAVQLAFLRGWTHEEIAAAAGEPLGTVKARIRRGLLGLRKALKDFHG